MKDSVCKVILCDAKHLQQAIAIVEAFAAELHTTFNLQLGESVGQCMQSEPDFVLVFMGATAAGCSAIPLNSM